MNRASAGKIGITLFWHAIDIILYGIAFKFLSEWYLTPTFHTATITWGKAFGLVLIARLLVQKHGEEQRDITIQNVFIEAVIPALFVEAGYLLHHIP